GGQTRSSRALCRLQTAPRARYRRHTMRKALMLKLAYAADNGSYRTRRLNHIYKHRRLTLTALLCGAALMYPIAAAAATESASHSGALFIAQLIALLLVGRLLGELMLRIGQPAAMGQLLAGIILGPSVFGSLYPIAQQALFPSDAGQSSMIEAVAQLGVLMLLLLTGMETDLA